MSQLLNNFHNQNKNMLYLECLSSVNRIFNEEEIYDKYKKQPKYKTVQKSKISYHANPSSSEASFLFH